MSLPRPYDLFDRHQEWQDLSAFATGSGAGVRVAVVHGRRRQGKSYLLRRLAAATGGFYHQAIEEEAAPALQRLGAALGSWLSAPGRGIALGDWTDAVDAIAELRGGPSGQVVAVIDELPYLLAQTPELPSLLQRAVDASSDNRDGSPVRLVLCGSALSVMSELLSGQRALRGRVSTILQVDPFDFREAASFWGVEGRWQVALRLDAIVGGTPGYRDLLGLDPPSTVAAVGDWLAAGVCNPASALFREDDYLLAEERGLSDRALYHSVLSAVAAGNRSEAKIAAALGRERQAISWPLRVLLDAGFLVRDDDARRQRRPSYRIAEPIVRFHHVVTRPDLARFEERKAREAWADAQQRFASQVLGPHFEDLARRWTIRYASQETVGGKLARVGATQINDRRSRSQMEVDLVGVDAGSSAVCMLGEAKSGARPVGVETLGRLERARDLLSERVSVASAAKLVVFSAAGFEQGLLDSARRRPEVELVDLDRLYTGG